tara:strand:+ start:889 stop:1473 length:585 start_codon:yes stop_codon:yes gene_type:complete
MNDMNLIPSQRLSGLIVITGPSGVGKGTIVKKLLERHKEIWLSISATTRMPRKDEMDGQHYFFVDKKDFISLINKGGFLEYAEFAGNYYGTPREEVLAKINAGMMVLLEIELEGARQVKKTFPDAFLLFLAPPSFEELERRIRGRETDSEQSIFKRLSRAKEELEAKKEFDAVLVNNEISQTLKELELMIGLNK